MLEWTWTQLQALWQYPEFQAVVVGFLLGVSLTEAVAHFLPPQMNAWEAERVVRLIAFGVATIGGFSLDPTMLGLMLAVVNGLVTPTAHHFGKRWLYGRWPQLEPKALKP